MKRILTLTICILICSVTCFAQKRKTIDRTKTETVRSTQKTQPKVSSSSEKRSTNKPYSSQVKRNSLTVSSETLSFSSAGGSRTITVNSSSSWRIGTRTYVIGDIFQLMEIQSRFE